MSRDEATGIAADEGIAGDEMKAMYNAIACIRRHLAAQYRAQGEELTDKKFDDMFEDVVMPLLKAIAAHGMEMIKKGELKPCFPEGTLGGDEISGPSAMEASRAARKGARN